MKKLIMGLLVTIFSFSSLATCKSEISQRLGMKKDNSEVVHLSTATSAGLFGITLIAAFPPAGVGVIAVGGSVSLFHELSKSKLKKLEAAIDESYKYKENGWIGKNLYKLFNKVRKSTEEHITIDQVVDTVIASNESGVLCDSNSINSFSKGISINF